MKGQIVNHPELKLVGLSVRTNNKTEMTPGQSKIGKLIERYWSENIAQHILHRVNPGVTIAGYTKYDSDEHGDYTYFYGEEVEPLDQHPIDLGLMSIIVPAAKYMKFTPPQGNRVEVVVSTWQKIWKMSQKDFGYPRKYLFDFEIYDKRAMNPNKSVIDFYIGLDV